MLRVSDAHTDMEHPHFMAVDKKKRQVTLTDPSAASALAVSTSQERGPMVAAPKMFAFDSLFTAEDQQVSAQLSARKFLKSQFIKRVRKSRSLFKTFTLLLCSAAFGGSLVYSPISALPLCLR